MVATMSSTFLNSSMEIISNLFAAALALAKIAEGPDQRKILRRSDCRVPQRGEKLPDISFSRQIAGSLEFWSLG